MQRLSLSIHGREDVEYKTVRNSSHVFGNVFGGSCFSSYRSSLENKLRNGVSVGKRMEQGRFASKIGSHRYCRIGWNSYLYCIKKTIVGYGLLLIDLVDGSSFLSVETAPQKQDWNCGISLRIWTSVAFCLDYWKDYQEFIPWEKHVQTKAKTYTVEGYNRGIRHYLARFKRKEKCDSKVEYMLQKSLNYYS